MIANQISLVCLVLLQGSLIARTGQSEHDHLDNFPVPALLIFGDHPWTDYLPHLHLDKEIRAEIVKAGREFANARHSQIEAFRRDSPLAAIVILPHTVHHCFIQRQARVVSEMRKFLAKSAVDYLRKLQ